MSPVSSQVLDRDSVNFVERRKCEVRRLYLSCTQVSRDKRKGWAMGKPTSNSRRERELLRR